MLRRPLKLDTFARLHEIRSEALHTAYGVVYNTVFYARTAVTCAYMLPILLERGPGVDAVLVEHQLHLPEYVVQGQDTLHDDANGALLNGLVCV